MVRADITFVFNMDGPYDDPYASESNPHDKAFAIIPKIGGGLTIIGSVMILRDIAFKIKRNRTIPLITKIMTLITVANLFIGFWENFLSTWMVPKDSESIHGSPVFMASGNIATCNTQAFITVLMFVIVETAYTMLSVLYYITVARRDWTTQKTESLKVMYVEHMCAVSIYLLLICAPSPDYFVILL